MGFFDNAQEVLDRGVSAAKGAVSGVAVEQQAFVKGFARLCSEGSSQGWHESNGGNASYRLAPEDVASSRSFFYDNPSSWVPLGVQVANLGGEFFLVTAAGAHMRNVALDPDTGAGIVEVNAAPVQALLDAGYIPVVAPVGTDGKGQSFNINGDTAAGKLASALGAEKLMLLTDIEGLCNDIKLRDVISYLNIADVQGLKDQGTIAGGMIPKVDCCVQAIEEGVTNVHIIDGRKPHSILYEAFTDEGIGTTVGKDAPSVGIKWK